MIHPQVKREYFTQLPNSLIDNDDLSPAALKGFIRLLRDKEVMDKEKFVGSLRKLSNRIRMSRMTTSRILVEWEKHNLIFKETHTKETENRDEMVLLLLIDTIWIKNSEQCKKQCPKLGQRSNSSVPNWDNEGADEVPDVPSSDISVPDQATFVPDRDKVVPPLSTFEPPNTTSNTTVILTSNTKRENTSEITASPTFVAAHADDAASLVSLLEAWRTGNAEEQRATLAALTHLLRPSSDTESHSQTLPVLTSSTADDGTAPSPIAIPQAQPLEGEEGEPTPSRYVVLTGALPGGYCFTVPFSVAVYEDVSGVTVSGERGTYAFAPTEEEALAQYKVLIVDEVQWLTRKEQELSVSLREELAYLRAHIGPSTLNPAVPASQLPVLAIGNHAENERALPPTNGTARSEVIQDEQEGTHVQKRATMTERGDSATETQCDENTREGVQGSITQAPTPIETQEIPQNKKPRTGNKKPSLADIAPLPPPERPSASMPWNVIKCKQLGDYYRGYTTLSKTKAEKAEKAAINLIRRGKTEEQVDATFRYMLGVDADKKPVGADGIKDAWWEDKEVDLWNVNDHIDVKLREIARKKQEPVPFASKAQPQKVLAPAPFPSREERKRGIV